MVNRLDALRAPGDSAARDGGTVCPSCGSATLAEDGSCLECQPRASPPARKSLYRLFLFARAHTRGIIFGFLLTLAGTAASMVPPYLTMPLVDKVLNPWDQGVSVPWTLALWYLLGLTGAALLTWVFAWSRTYVVAWVSERVSADLRGRTYAHLHRLSLEFFGGKRTGDLITRLDNDTDRICNFLSMNLVDFASDLLMILMTGAILLTIDAYLALAGVAPVLLIIWLAYWVRGRLVRGFRRAAVAWADMVNVLADAIPGVRVVKAFAQENREIERFDASNRRVLQANDRVNLVWSFFGPMVGLVTAGGLLVIWSVGSYEVFQHRITVGVLIAFLAYVARIYPRVESMARMAQATQRAAASAQRIFEILDRTPSVAEPVRPVQPGRLAGRIELKGVRFKYGPREVIHGVDLAIEPGEMIGLVGPTGAGKSTLINLICRFYDVAAGAVLVDGTDVRSFPVEAYRRNIGIVLQDPFLFYGTVAENIAYGCPSATREQIIAAARAARAHEFILRLPDGYDSVVGERGQALSGGERQRISIARALLIDPRILILDEATSSVDIETEREIQTARETLIKCRTTIAIAHRLSTLRRAHRLVVLDHGRIAEIGNHQELLRARGTYARLHQAQLEMAQSHAV